MKRMICSVLVVVLGGCLLSYPEAKAPDAATERADAAQPGDAATSPCAWTWVEEDRVASLPAGTSTYHLVRPANQSAKLPLAIVLHPYTGSYHSARAIREALGLEQPACQTDRPAVFVYVHELEDVSTLAGRGLQAVLILEIITKLRDQDLVDPQRVLLVGYDGGGFLSTAIGCALNRGSNQRVIQLVVTMSGTLYQIDGKYAILPSNEAITDCAFNPAVMIIWGQDDKNAGTMYDPAGLYTLRDQYEEHQGCRRTTSEQPGCNEITTCMKGRLVFCSVPALGHDLWVDAGRRIWAFFGDL